MPLFVLSALSVALGIAVFDGGGVWPATWSVCLLAVALLSLVYFLSVRRWDRAPSLSRRARWLGIALFAFLLLQLAPLPLSVVRLLAPARAALSQAAAPALGAAPFITLSAVPAATLRMLLTISACALVFLLVRELAWRFETFPWAPALPLMILAVLEGVLGIVQAWAYGGAESARGTYANRNHYAGLLELCLPFLVMAAFAALARHRRRHAAPLGPVLLACALLACATLVLVAVLFSLSRMGFIATLFSFFVMGVVGLGGRLGTARKWGLGLALAAAIVAGFVFLPTDRLIARFADIAATDDISGDTRAQVWRDTLPLIRDYALFGCGLGGYESCLTAYKSVAPMNTVDYAHNDYLQVLAEAGLAGFAPLLAFAIAALASAGRRAAGQPRSPVAWLAVASTGALGAILLHSTVDYNLYIPANALVVAWVGALAVNPARAGALPEQETAPLDTVRKFKNRRFARPGLV